MDDSERIDVLESRVSLIEEKLAQIGSDLAEVVSCLKAIEVSQVVSIAVGALIFAALIV